MYRLSLWNILVSRSCQWSRGSALQVSATVILALSTFSPANAFRETVDQAEHGKALQCRPCYRCPSDGIFPILIGLFGGMTLHLLDLLKSFHRVVCVASAGDDVGSGRPSDWTSWKSLGITKDSRRYWAASRIIAQLISIPWFSAVSVHSDTLCSSFFSECNQIHCVLSDFDLAHTINYLLKEKCKSMRAPALRIQPRTYSLIKNRCGLTYSAKKRKYAEQMCVFL